MLALRAYGVFLGLNNCLLWRKGRDGVNEVQEIPMLRY